VLLQQAPGQAVAGIAFAQPPLRGQRLGRIGMDRKSR